jgi:hypothetical protein
LPFEAKIQITGTHLPEDPEKGGAKPDSGSSLIIASIPVYLA